MRQLDDAGQSLATRSAACRAFAMGNHAVAGSVCCLAMFMLAATGCNSFAPPWLAMPNLNKPAEQSQLSPPATSADHQSSAGASQPPKNIPTNNAPPLPERTATGGKAMAEYVNELAKGVGLEQAGKYDEARQHFQKLIEKWPGEYQAYHHLGQVCDRQKHYAEAQDCYQHAILLAQGHEPAIFNDLGYSYYLQGNLDKAESALRKAVAMRPSEQKYHNNLGLVYGHQHRFEDAWKEFRQADGEADAYYNLAFVKSSLNDFEGAKACFRQVLAVDPSHERALRALRAFEVADTDPESLTQMECSNDSGTEWVPYVEGASSQDGTATTPATADKAGTATASPRVAGASRAGKPNRSN